MAEFSNPNQPGGQDNRSLIAMMVVFVAIILGVQYYHTKISPPPASSQPAPAASTQHPVPTPPPAAGQPAPSQPTPSGPSGPVVQAESETSTVIENGLFRVQFSNRGAHATNWILKGPQFTDSDGNPLDLVHHQAAEQFGYPLSIHSSDASVASKLNQALFVPSQTGHANAPATVTFKYSDGDIEATKTFTFNNTYVLHAEVSVTRHGAAVPVFISWPGGFGDQNETPSGTEYNNSQLDTDRNGSDEHLAPKKVSNEATVEGPFDWAGISDPYFAAVFLPDSPDQAKLITFNRQLDVAKTIKRVGFGSNSPPKGPMEVPVLGAALGNPNGPTQTRIFVGPKAIKVLKSIHAANSRVTLEPLLEFGFWGFIGKYLFLALQAIHSFIAGWKGAWGWAIILLTVIINVLILPSRIKTMQSAVKMQRIQPQMDAIKEKYKKYKVTDPKRNEMNAEIMELQKANGVNMFGGCIPQLITLPLLYAFFTMLPRVVELRHASWLWLPNLQAADPTHILPILTIVFQFLMQYYTPSPGVDPQQQKMMAFMMPAFFGYMTWNYASGIALYWLVGLLIGILQQAVMNQTSLGKEMREIAAKRARRKASPGTIQGKR